VGGAHAEKKVIAFTTCPRRAITCRAEKLMGTMELGADATGSNPSLWEKARGEGGGESGALGKGLKTGGVKKSRHMDKQSPSHRERQGTLGKGAKERTRQGLGGQQCQVSTANGDGKVQERMEYQFWIRLPPGKKEKDNMLFPTEGCRELKRGDVVKTLTPGGRGSNLCLRERRDGPNTKSRLEIAVGGRGFELASIIE